MSLTHITLYICIKKEFEICIVRGGDNTCRDRGHPELHVLSPPLTISNSAVSTSKTNILHSQFMTKIQVGHGDKSWSNLG